MPGVSTPGSAPESLAAPVRDRSTVLLYVILLVIAVLSWAHVLWMALMDDMAGMDMEVDLGWLAALAYVTAWTTMMAAMMLPSALPMIALYAATTRRLGGRARAVRVALFTLVYLGLWGVSGLPTYLASVTLSRLGTTPRAYAVAAMLIVAGLFQLSPLKRVCLRHCRSPLGYFLGHWRAGWRGALSLGGSHAVYCVGCCWALMLVLVVAGAMGLAWVLLVAVVVAAEKLLPWGEWTARVAGVALVVLGVAVAFRPALAATLRGVGHPM